MTVSRLFAAAAACAFAWPMVARADPACILAGTPGTGVSLGSVCGSVPMLPTGPNGSAQQVTPSNPLPVVIEGDGGGGGGSGGGSVTAAGTNGTTAQAVQGITGGVPQPVTGGSQAWLDASATITATATTAVASTTSRVGLHVFNNGTAALCLNYTSTAAASGSGCAAGSIAIPASGAWLEDAPGNVSPEAISLVCAAASCPATVKYR